MERRLDRIALRRDVNLLTKFFDDSELAAEFAEFEDDESLPEPVWFDSTAGLETTEALLAEVTESPDLFTFADDPTRSHWRSKLTEELEDCREIQKRAVADGLPFHFAIIM